MSKNIVIVGGGTAGWMSALMARKHYPQHKVTLIESDEIGILGAGEGTTPQFINFLDEVNIPITDIIDEVGLMFKFGIDFKNWTGDGSSYTHPFLSSDTLDPFTYMDAMPARVFLESGANLDLACPLGITLPNHKVPARLEDAFLPRPNKIFGVTFYDKFGVHFDARLMANALKKIAISRGVKRVEGKVTAAVMDKNNFIAALDLQDGTKIPADFVFDCTGFRRMFIGEIYKSEWISFADFLPMKAAVPFFIPHDNNVDAVTNSIAMENGWMWQIPVRDRYGCGYVFDTDYATKEEVLAEASAHFDREITSDKVFKFSPGCFKDVYINNCVAIGLSQGFVEPLEATSLLVTYLQLQEIMSIGLFKKRKPADYADYNDYILEINTSVADFLHLHYLGNRNTSKFWREFKEKNRTPDRVTHKINEYARGNLDACSTITFERGSHGYIMSGLKFPFKCDTTTLDATAVNKFLSNLYQMTSQCTTHKQLIDRLSGG